MPRPAARARVGVAPNKGADRPKEAQGAAAPAQCPAASRPRGRPRSVTCHQAILRATMELLTEFRYADVTMEGIAARAGVSKQTLYNWWPSKARLAMEAYAATAATRIPEPDTGSTQEDLQRLLCFTCQVLGRGETSLGATLAGLIAAAQSDEEVGCELRETLIGARRRVATRVLTRRGDLVLMDSPVFPTALQAFHLAGLRGLSVPKDGDGLIPEALEAMLKRERPKLLYIVPTYSNPDGSVLAGVAALEEGLLRRPELLAGTLTEKLLTFALGRGVESHDAPAVRKIVRAAAAEEACAAAPSVAHSSSFPASPRRPIAAANSSTGR